MHKLKLKVNKFESGLWSYHIIIPDAVVEEILAKGTHRVICNIDNIEDFHCALMHDGTGQRYIMLNKDKMKRYKLLLGQEVWLQIRSDDSKYGMLMPAVFEELLFQDPEGEKYFEALTPGKKRSLIHIVAKLKSEEKQLRKSLVILHHLKTNRGELDYKMLNQAMKNSNQDLDAFFR